MASLITPSVFSNIVTLIMHVTQLTVKYKAFLGSTPGQEICEYGNSSNVTHSRTVLPKA